VPDAADILFPPRSHPSRSSDMNMGGAHYGWHGKQFGRCSLKCACTWLSHAGDVRRRSSLTAVHV